MSLFGDKIGKKIKHEDTKSIIKLYLNCQNLLNKKNKNVKICQSIHKHLNYFGLKGKKEAINKKNFETPLVTSSIEGQTLIDSTITSIERFYQPIKIYKIEIDYFFNKINKIFWFKRYYTKNKNKLQTNFVIYLDDENRAIIEIENCVYWFNSSLSYLS